MRLCLDKKEATKAIWEPEVIPWQVKPSLAKSSQVMAKSKCLLWLDYDVSSRSNQKRRVEVLERGWVSAARVGSS